MSLEPICRDCATIQLNRDQLLDLTEKVFFPHYKKSTKIQLIKFLQVEFFKLAVEFEEEGTGTVVKEETSASLKDKVSEAIRT